MTLEYPNELIPILLGCTSLRFDKVINLQTGEVRRFQTSEKFQDMSFIIYPKSGKVIMKGSWAKFHNEGIHNYTRYIVSDFIADLDRISNFFSYDFSQGLILGAEIGVNLNMVDLPQPIFSPDYLIPRIISYQGRLPLVPMKTIRGAGQGIECLLENHRIKVYDKGAQYHLPYPVLRFEYDCNSSKELRGIGIRKLADLTDMSKLEVLGEKLVKMFADLVLLEPLKNDLLSASKRKLYENAEKHRFWIDMKRHQRCYY